MDPENLGKEAIIRVTDWLRNIWEMKRNSGQVQQWVDSIPSPTKKSADIDIKIESHNSPSSPSPSNSKTQYLQKPIMTISTPILVPNSSALTMTSIPSRLTRDPSLQSDSSHCSSVESLLELRRADPEAILLGLGFGGCPGREQENGTINRIPKRFLQPSKLKGIAIEEFIKQQQETSEFIDTASLGYRGLAGSPHVAPSEIVQKIMERLREHESHELDAYNSYNSEHHNCFATQEGKHSVLSPDNREFLERPRSKSPDMRNKRMIIGQKSFAFSRDGDLIEIIHPNNNRKHSKSSGNPIEYENNRTSLFLTESIDADVDSDYQKHEESFTKSNSSSIEYKLTQGLEDYSEKNTCTVLKQSRLNNSINICNDVKIKLELELSSSSSSSSSSSPSSLRSQRRASCGFNDPSEIHLKLYHNEGRRFSDGIIKLSSHQSPAKRRGGLRRQSRINDADASCYYESSECDNLASDIAPIINQNNEEEPLQFDDNLNTNPTDESNDDNLCDGEGSDLRSKNDQLDQICRHDITTKKCYYHKDNTSCWRNMRKIMKKNQKLEHMVVKSRHEVAELRDMLSNVLTVRMEPGF